MKQLHANQLKVWRHVTMSYFRKEASVFVATFENASPKIKRTTKNGIDIKLTTKRYKNDQKCVRVHKED